jgi:anaerobic ribonucleoside-triphosphate reductase
MISAGRSVDLPSYESAKKFIGASFFKEIHARLKILKTHLWPGHVCIWSLEAHYNELHASLKLLKKTTRDRQCDK